MFVLRCLSFIWVDVSGKGSECLWSREVWAGDWEFQASSMDEIIRKWVLIEKQPEDQALRLSSVMGSVEQEVTERRLRGMKAVWWKMVSSGVGKVQILSLACFLPFQWFSIFFMVPFHQIPLVFLIPDNNCSSSQSMVSWLAAPAPPREEGLLKMKIVGSTLGLQMRSSKG